MRANNITGLRRNRRARTTIKARGVQTRPDPIRREFTPDSPNKLWVADDITYLRTHEGWLCLAVVVDAFSRRLGGRLDLDALEMAVWRRDPEPGVIHHSDHGSQYTALIFGERCRDAGIELSMGSTGSAFDNAVAESFFKTLKTEFAYRWSWQTKAELRLSVIEWIEVFYNRKRLHSTLGYRSPKEFGEMSTESNQPLPVS